MKFDQVYNQKDFLQFLEYFLPENFAAHEEDLVINKERYKKISRAQILGVCGSLDLQVLEMHHDNANDPRLTIATDAFKILADHWIHNALVIFKSNNSTNYRFSLLTISLDLNEKNKPIKKYSNARRYSFYLGPNAKINTPTKFLISNGKITDFEDLKKRFSIEVVNKEFYKEISQAFIELVSGLLKLPSTQDESKINLEFAVRLIGRIIFCWFLREKKSQAGLALMTEELLSLEAVIKNDDYYHKILEPIFFEVLNKPIKSRNDDFAKEPFTSIPYLNGGLFSPQDDDYYKRANGDFQSQFHNTLIIPNNWFKDFFEILETYNFTIDENTSYDEELSIDPEMLGRIFENLLAEINPGTGESARKSTGSYYTPRAIVSYMVDESLLLYLKEQTEIKEEKLRTIISYDLSDDSEHSITIEEKEKIIDALEKVKILDPACGSGAFPMGALQKIVFILQQTDPDGQLWFKKQIKSTSPEIRRLVEREFTHKNFDYIRKLGIIRENIYGVDIQPIATEISRLRCFLTLIVDERIQDGLENRGIEPLPNLDFKFVTANSLIGLPKIDQSQQSMFDDYQKINELRQIRDQYFNAFGIEREQLKTEFVTQQKKLVDQLIKEHGFMGIVKAELTQKLTNWEPFTHKLTLWFDPEWMFGIKDGFDVVIGNPPYVGEKGNKEIFRSVANGNLKEFYQGKMDIFYFFFHLALNLCKEYASIAFITTNYYFTAQGGRKLREDFKRRAIVERLINFNELKIFESATGQHNMITILKKGNDDQVFAKTSISKRKGVAAPEILNEIMGLTDKKTDYFEVVQKDLYDGDESYIRLAGNSITSVDPTQAVLRKLKYGNELLGDLFYINSGADITISRITKKHLENFDGNFSRNDGVFVLSNAETRRLNLEKNEHEIVKRFIKNSDIYSYGVKFNDDVLLYLRWEDNINKYPNIKKHLLRFKEILEDQQNRYGESYPWFALHRPREKYIFESEKIIVPYRSDKNKFGYADYPLYSSRDVLFITERDGSVSLKYILALLNSRLYYIWLYHRGKRKGDILELVQKPLSEIPVKKILQIEQKPFVDLVEKILKITKTDDYLKNAEKQAKVHDFEHQIDKMVYKLYDLEPEEIKIVESPL